MRDEQKGELGRPAGAGRMRPWQGARMRAPTRRRMRRLASRRMRRLEPHPARTASRSKPAGQKRRAGPSKNRLTAQAAAEREIEEAEAALRALEDELADPAAWATRYESAKSEARHTAARRAVEEAYARLEALVE